MADGTPDFTDLLAAFDDPPAVNLPQNASTIGHGLIGANLQPNQLQFANIQNVQLNTVPYGTDQNSGLFTQVNQNVMHQQGQLRQIVAEKHGIGMQDQQNFIQPASQVTLATNAPPAAEESPFAGGSLGSMFLSSVEMALSDEGNQPYVVKINQPAPQPRNTQRRQRQRQKQNVQPRTAPQVTRLPQNVNANSSVQVSMVNDVTVQRPIQAAVSLQNRSPMTSNVNSIKMLPVSSPPFILPNDIQMGPGPISGGQKMIVQNQFMHPTNISRQQQPLGQIQNPPRPLSAASSTSDQLSRPGSVPQPSPSCGSSHSGDPATPLTPQSYGAVVPQNYNAATPQSRSSTPQTVQLQQQHVGIFPDASQQIQNQALDGILPQNSGISSMQSPMKSHNSSDSLSDFPTPVKELLSGSQVTYGTIPPAPGFQSATSVPASSMVSKSRVDTGLRQIQATNMPMSSHTQITAPIPSNIHPNIQMNPGYGQTANTFNAGQYFERTEGSDLGSGSLTLNQTKLLEQIASFGNKSKTKTIGVAQPLPVGLQGSSGAVSSGYRNISRPENSQNSTSVGRLPVQTLESNSTMDMMNKATNAGAATVKELFSSHAAQYEAISPVSDYAVSPINKVNLSEDLTENSLFGTAKFGNSSGLQTDRSVVQNASEDVLTDPVLMYIKQDDITQTATSTNYSSNHTVKSFSHQSAFDPFSTNTVATQKVQYGKDTTKPDATNTTMTKSEDSHFLPNSFPGSSMLPASSNLPRNPNPVASNTDWRPLPMLSQSDGGKASMSTTANEQTVSAGAVKPNTMLDAQTLFFKRKEEPHALPPSDQNSSSIKPGAFGVSRRKSSTELAKQGVSMTQMGKSNSSASGDFGFDSDDDTEPTICLSKPAKPKKSASKQVYKVDVPLPSPKRRIVNMGADVQQSLEQMKKLQQQKQLLLQMQQRQAEQAARASALPICTSIQATSRPMMAKATPTSHQFHPKDTFSLNQKPKAPITGSKAPTVVSSSTMVRKNSGDSFTSYSAGMQIQSRRAVPIQSKISSFGDPSSHLPSQIVSHYPTPVQLQSKAPSLTSLSNLPSSMQPSGSQPLAKPASVHVGASNSNTTSTSAKETNQHQLTVFSTAPVTKNSADIFAQSAVSMSVPHTVLPSSRPIDFSHSAMPSFNAVQQKIDAPNIPLNVPSTKVISPQTSSILAVTSASPLMPFSFSSIPVSQNFLPTHYNSPITTFTKFAASTPFPPPMSTVGNVDQKAKYTSTIAMNQLDLDWLHQASDVPPPFQKPVARQDPSPSLTIMPPRQSLSAQAESTNCTATLLTTPVVTKPVPSADTAHRLLNNNDQKTETTNHTTTSAATTAQTALATSAISVTESSAVVHHETKQHHHGRKHRILEGVYPGSTDFTNRQHQPTSHVPNQSPQTDVITQHVAQSVLDKQRRYSKEHNLARPKKLLHQIGDANRSQGASGAEPKEILKQNLKEPEPKLVNVSASPTEVTAISGSVQVTVAVATMAAQKPGVERQLPNAKSTSGTEKEIPTGKDDQEGSMLSMFSLLLQEASKSAADSLKTKLTTSPEEQAKTGLNAATSGSMADLTTTETNANAPAPVKNKPNSQMPASVASSSTSVTTSVVSDIVPERKVFKKVRPAATVPFKRRPYPAFDDYTASNVSIGSVVATSGASTTTVSVSSTMATPSVAPIAHPIISTKTTSATTTPHVPGFSVSVATPVASSLVTESKPAIPVGVLSAPVMDKKPAKSAGLPKLRITAFRSSGGQVIHQASMIGATNTAGLDQEISHRHSKKKKKKKRKKKRRVSSSDYDSSVSSMTSMSSFEPSAKVPLKVDEEKVGPLGEDAVKTDPAAKTSEGSPKQVQKRKRANTSTVNKEEDKKKSSSVAAKRPKLTKETTKKKCEAKKKEPVARYQPKSAYHSGATTSGTSANTKGLVSLPSNYHRAPGKLPLYMNSSENSKSATVPTIQLVARNTKLLETVVDNKSTKPNKVLSVKIANSVASKPFPAQLLTAGFQYVPGTRGQQRIILPNISSSMPVSIVSPLMNRIISSTLIPASVNSQTTSPATNKSRLLPLPISISDTVTTPVKFVSSKQMNALKSPDRNLSDSSATTNGSSLTAVPSTAATTSRAGTATVSVVQGGPTVLGSPSKVSSLLGSPLTNSFQSTFSKLISSQNPVQRYTPPPPPTHLKMDLHGSKHHQCLECKDTFMFQSSLADHYERRSILIKVRCMQCNQSLLFLNKCKLLKHARQHSDKGNGMQFNNAHISPLPLSMCKPRSKESFLSKMATDTAEKRRSTASSEDDIGAGSLHESHSSTTACTDCGYVAGSPEALEEHFQQQTAPVSPDVSGSSNVGVSKAAPKFTCDICNLTLCNQCSFMAHMRMHKRVAPHTCPECGQTFDYDGKDMDFNLHLSIQCFHLSRMSCYKCRLCSSIFKNGDLLRHHLEVRHLQTFYKCKDCPMAFKTQENIASHQRTAHGVVAVTKTIHKCPLCDTVFTDNSPTQQLFLLQKHFDNHINHPSINITAYKCLFCNNIYERKSLLREHLKSVHDVMSSADSGSSRDLSKEIGGEDLLLNLDKKRKSINGNFKKLTGSKVMRKRSANDRISQEIPSKVAKTTSDIRSSEDANSLIASGILGNVDGTIKKGMLGGKIISANTPAVMKHARQPVKLRLKGMTGHSTISVTSSKLHTISSLENGSDDAASTYGSEDQLGDKANYVLTQDGKKMFPCNECQKMFPSTHARFSHVRLKHKGIRTLYCCAHCPIDEIKFAKRISLKKHLKKVHNIVEINKQDIRTVCAHVPPVPAGQRFDPSSITLKQDGKQDPLVQATLKVKDHTEGPVGHKQVRKKFTALGRKSNAEKLARRVVRPAGTSSPVMDLSDSEDEQTNHSESEDAQKAEENLDFSKLWFPEVYKCAKCEYESPDRLEFQVHIIEHKENAEIDEGRLSSIQQCTECGLCFASSVSHAKHLFIKHKIKRKRLLEKYDEKLRIEREAAGSLPKSLMAEDGSLAASGSNADTRRHRCSVCFRRFADDGLLRTHMRTHGLAFVKSKHVN